MFAADCPRRKQFPSWTWAVWQGSVEFGPRKGSDHEDFFGALTSPQWEISTIWSAETILSAADGSESTVVSGREPIFNTGDPGKTWLLTTLPPLVLMSWRQLKGKDVEMHLSVKMTAEELVDGVNNGELLPVLVFASTVPFIWNGIAKFLILRKCGQESTRWERIGRLQMRIEEWEMKKYGNVEGILSGLPIHKLGKNIVLQ